MPRWSLLLLCLLSHLQCCQSFLPVPVPTESLPNKKEVTNSFVLPLPPLRTPNELLPLLLLGVRVGEAQLPGPIRVALVNPTSIVSKISQFDSLVSQHSVSIICASETSATAKAQKLFSQQVRSDRYVTSKHCGHLRLTINSIGWMVMVACEAGLQVLVCSVNTHAVMHCKPLAQKFSPLHVWSILSRLLVNSNFRSLPCMGSPVIPPKLTNRQINFCVHPWKPQNISDCL